MPRIALIHATPVAIQPVADAFAAGWPEATVTHLLEDSLSMDLKSAGELNQAMVDRFIALGRYTATTKADGILFTCSAFGPAIDAVKRDITHLPVLKPNEAMFEEAIERGGRIAMLATFQPSVPPMEEEFHQGVARLGSDATLETRCVDGAMDALLADDPDRHNQLVADTAGAMSGFDTILLAHFSTAKAKAAVESVVSCPVLTSPDSAVRKLKALIS